MGGRGELLWKLPRGCRRACRWGRGHVLWWRTSGRPRLMESRCRRPRGGDRRVCKEWPKVLIFESQLDVKRSKDEGLLPITKLLFLRHSALSPSTAWMSCVRHIQHNHTFHVAENLTQADCGVVRVTVYNLNPASLLPSICIGSWESKARTFTWVEAYLWIAI